MMLQMQGTGPLLVVILVAIAALLVVLLAVGAVAGSVKPKQALVFSAIVVLATVGYLSWYAYRGGDFPRFIRYRVVPRRVENERNDLQRAVVLLFSPLHD
jgi:hypothetical protein